ncbi:MAG: type II secretion system protein GspG [Prosthecobacter sp.]
MKIRIVAVLIIAVVVAIIIGARLGGWGDELPASSVRAPKPVVLPTVKITPPAATPMPSPVAQVAAPPPEPAPPVVATVVAPVVAMAPAPMATPAAAASPGSGDSSPTKPSADLVTDAAVQIDKIGLMFRDYRTLMGSNPTGTNAEIIQSVNGGNPKQAKLGPPEGQQINARGELIDAWGTAYFFHQKSASDMEIHSAGPDKQFGTSDDVIGR